MLRSFQTKNFPIIIFIAVSCIFCVSEGISQELYTLPKNVENQWFSFENKIGEKGKGGIENKGAKGRAFELFKAGATVTLLETSGSGVIQRIWMTLNDRSPKMLRSLRLKMYWDQADKPAVDVPLGDFFGIGLGKKNGL